MFGAKIIPFFYLITLTGSYRVIHVQPGAFISAIKLFWSNSDNGTVSKFPPIVEYFVQRIQSQNSVYVHEDLSRPPTWEKPVYTLAPSELAVTQKDEPSSTTPDPFEYEELEETTEKFFETASP